jgi:hypothetical protein
MIVWFSESTSISHSRWFSSAWLHVLHFISAIYKEVLKVLSNQTAHTTLDLYAVNWNGVTREILHGPTKKAGQCFCAYAFRLESSYESQDILYRFVQVKHRNQQEDKDQDGIRGSATFYWRDDLAIYHEAESIPHARLDCQAATYQDTAWNQDNLVME